MPDDDRNVQGEGRDAGDGRSTRHLDPAVLRSAIENAISGRPEIAAAYLYGSAERGTATPLSDVDVGLLFQAAAGDFQRRLAIATDIGSAIARTDPGMHVDVRDLEELPLAIRGPAVTEGVLVASNDEPRRVAFERDTRRRYFDFLPVHRAEVEEANVALRRRFGGG